MKKVSIINFIIITSIFVYQVIINNYSSKSHKEKVYDVYLEKSFNGLVKEKIVKRNRMSSRYIHLDNEKKVAVLYNNERKAFYDSLLVGDSIFKEEGSPYVTIMRGDQEFKMFFVDSTIYNKSLLE
ncbi:hypothetical protein [Flammeovirga sp. SJP92]|uniref:hypothetical protein n=1 Tax=Flammeovirga sp. SJP92 TaxID=1775430 RepID=UPI000787121D|nr:hypothetical protein [Flammeovirga sp. SJP92]KXX72222.1 hypothetical protein AVL50_01070 [Flammeovirga sp. SJP92]